MPMLYDNTKELVQYGQFLVKAVEKMELNSKEKRLEICLKDGDVHYFRYTCVISFMRQNDKPLLTIS